MSKAEILAELPKLQREERSEVFDQLCALEEAKLSSVHQQLVDEALSSGPARPSMAEDWDGALRRGLRRSRSQT